MTLVVASDIVSFTKCPRRLWYEYNPPPGMEQLEADPFEQIILRAGLEHEAAIRRSLEEDAEVVEATSVDHTQQLMDRGVEIIYQGELLDTSEQLFGKPDFLLRQGDGTYQAADAKLAQSVKPEIGVQLAFYRRLLSNDHAALAYLGNGSTAPVANEFDTRLERFVVDARTILSSEERPAAYYSESKCGDCPYYDVCTPEFVDNEELTLLYGLDSRSVPRLVEHGVRTISDLARTEASELPDNIPYLKGARKDRAVLQARAWQTGEMIKLHDIELPEGSYVHFDIEVNPQTPDGHQQVYLWGFLKPPYGDGDFDYVWANSTAEEEAAWHAFLTKVEEYRAAWPDLKLTHFAHYERTQIAACAERFGMTEHPTVAWLLDNTTSPLYDIQKAVTDNLVLPLSGYGLKQICKDPNLVDFQWEDGESGSQWSVVQYIEFLRSEDDHQRQQLKASILTYNRDDVRATQKLQEWLRSL